jgi:DNA-directed RNA polymerase specialized sigma24 family protein
MHQYKLGQSSNPQTCHELLRRAFDEQQHEAFDQVFILFAPRLRVWLHRHIKSDKDLIEDVVQGTFARLLQESQRRTFVVASFALPQVLAYIRKCTLIVLKEYSMSVRESEIDLSQVASYSVEQQIEKEHVRSAIHTTLLQDLTPDELELLYLRHVDNVKPADIARMENTDISTTARVAYGIMVS